MHNQGVCIMLKKLLYPLFFLLVLEMVSAAPFGDEVELSGELESSVGLSYRKAEKKYTTGFPLYGQVRLFHGTEKMESVISLYYRQGLDIGETYLKGGSEYSYMKIGYFIEDWGKGYSVSPLEILNDRDDRFPSNIFYRRYYKPNPIMLITVGSDQLQQQVVLLNRRGGVSSVNNTDLGLRGVWNREDYNFSIGLVRMLGYPPPLIFLTIEQEGTYERAWLEFGWEYHKKTRDLWDFNLGFSREFSASEMRAEYIINGFNTYLFIEDIFTINQMVKFDFKIFLHIPDFSSAFNTFFTLNIDNKFDFEPGIFLFIGKRGKYFSPHRGENYTSVYFKLKYSF